MLICTLPCLCDEKSWLVGGNCQVVETTGEGVGEFVNMLFKNECKYA